MPTIFFRIKFETNTGGPSGMVSILAPSNGFRIPSSYRLARGARRRGSWVDQKACRLRGRRIKLIFAPYLAMMSRASLSCSIFPTSTPSSEY